MTTLLTPNELATEQFARKITAHLSASEADLPYVVTERLRAARVQAVSQRKRQATRTSQVAETSTLVFLQPDGTASLGQTGPSDNTPLWLRRVLTALPLLALAGALAFINADQDNRSTVDVAELDAALLTSELPPAAYTDPGFLQYLQASDSNTP